MSFVPGTERWQFYPRVSKDDAVQAQRDASTLYDQVACVATHYGLDRDRMARALAVLSREWPTWAAKGRP